APWPAGCSLDGTLAPLVETARPSRDDLRDLLAGRRPARPPIPASLLSRDPLARPWPALLDDLARVHAEIVADLDAAPDDWPTDVRARVVVVMNAEATDGATVAVTWEDGIDWKAYAGFLRLHAMDHLSQARKVIAAIEGRHGSAGAP